MNVQLPDPSLDAPGLSAVPLDLKELGAMCADLVARQITAAALTVLLKTENTAIKELEEGRIPSFLGEAGLSLVALEDGTRIEVGENLTASIAGKTLPIVIDWLRKTNNDGLISTEVTSCFAKGKLADAEKLFDELKERNLSVELAENVNTGSFKSLVKELLEAGESLPLEELGVYIVRKAVVKRPK